MKALNEDSGVKQPCGWLAEVRRGEFGGNLMNTKSTRFSAKPATLPGPVFYLH